MGTGTYFATCVLYFSKKMQKYNTHVVRYYRVCISEDNNTVHNELHCAVNRLPNHVLRQLWFVR